MRNRAWIPWVLALAYGALVAWIDSRPTWDDDGITAGLLFLGAGALGAITPRGAWRWGLAVGMWITALMLAKEVRAIALVPLAIALVGSLVGSVAGRALGRLEGPSAG